MNIINLTSHTINELISGTEIKPSGVVARVEQTQVKVGEYKKMPIYKSTYGDVAGLPDKQENTIYIVSAMAFNAIPEWRTDVVCPGYVKRDESGKIAGCIGLKTKEQK